MQTKAVYRTRRLRQYPVNAIARARAHRYLSWKALSSVAGVFAVAWISWSALTHFEPRVTPEDATKRLEALDQLTDELMQQALDSEERGATTIDFGARKVAPQYIASINRLSLRVLRVREPLLTQVHLNFQDDLRSDVSSLVRELGDCGSQECANVLLAIRENEQTHDAVIDVTHRVGKILSGSNALLRKDPTRSVDGLVEVNRFLADALSDEELLIHSLDKPVFDDVLRARAATWNLLRIQQQLHRDYQNRHRVIEALKVVVGR